MFTYYVMCPRITGSKQVAQSKCRPAKSGQKRVDRAEPECSAHQSQSEAQWSVVTT